VKDQLQLIRSNAAFAIENFGALTAFEFGHNRQSVEWVEGFIERQRERGGDHYKMIGIVGSFLGEAVIAQTGGTWVAAGDTFGVQFQNGDNVNTCFPFGKVAKQFEIGLDAGESVLAFYDLVVDVVAKGKQPYGDEGAK
jgi:hypothetical protein